MADMDVMGDLDLDHDKQQGKKKEKEKKQGTKERKTPKAFKSSHPQEPNPHLPVFEGATQEFQIARQQFLKEKQAKEELTGLKDIKHSEVDDNYD